LLQIVEVKIDITSNIFHISEKNKVW